MNNRSATIEVLQGNSQIEKDSRKTKQRKERTSQNSIDGLFNKPKAGSSMGNYGAPRQM